MWCIKWNQTGLKDNPNPKLIALVFADGFCLKRTFYAYII